MGRISAGVGLISGLNTQDIVTQLLAIEARPIDLLNARIAKNQERQTALSTLSAQLLTLQLSATSFGSSPILDARSATSSNTSLIAAVAQTGATPANYQLRPVRQAQTQRFLSAGFADTDTAAVGAGTLTVKLGGFVAPTTALDTLNGGLGVGSGKIRITDRSGAGAVIDLSSALSIDDVVQAINQTESIAVRASTSGDALKLTDQTGLTASNLIVQEVGAGTTGADLGLLGSVAANTLTGADIVKLGGQLSLDVLNDNNGVRKSVGSDDFRITLKDASTIDVSLANTQTVQDVLDSINNDAENLGNLQATIAAGGNALVLTDTSGGGGTLSVTALNSSYAAADLGILGNEQGGGVLTGKRNLAGLESVLLSNLNGGSGITTLGQVQLTDRSGASNTINLAGADTLDDVITAINGAGLGLVATLNSVGHGILITDTTGSTTSNLIISDTTGTTATDLNIAANVAATTVDSGDLNQRYISQNTRLSSLNGGKGVAQGSILITDTGGGSAVVNLSGSSITTIGDVIVALEAAAVGITAQINDTGDGILITDTAAGSGQLSIAEQNNGTTAADLRLLGSGATEIDGAYRYQITLDSDDALEEVATKLQESGAPATATIINDGASSKPYRLFVTADRGGKEGRLLIDSGTTGLNLAVTQDGADAVLELSGGAGGGSPLVFVSSSNAFLNVLPGLSVDVLGTSTSAVNVTVTEDTQPLKSAVDQFVSNFNSLSDALSAATAFDPDTETRTILQGDRTALQIESALFNLVNDYFGPANGSVRRLADVGITLTNGKLSVNQSKLDAKIAEDSAAIRDFFAAEDDGVADQLEDVLQSFTDSISGLMAIRINTLVEQAEDLEERVSFLTERLEARRLRMLNEFLILEKVLAQLQSQEQSLADIVYIEPVYKSSSSN